MIMITDANDTEGNALVLQPNLQFASIILTQFPSQVQVHHDLELELEGWVTGMLCNMLYDSWESMQSEMRLCSVG
jgi:hypothetical protein